MLNKKLKFLAGTILFLALFFLPSCVFSANISVSGSDFDDIQDVIVGANSSDVINLNNITYSGNGNQIRIINQSVLTIQGSSSGYATLDARGLSRIMVVDENSTVTFKYINFVNGNSGTGAGTGIYTYGQIIVENCNFVNNVGESGTGVFLRDNATGSSFINCNFVNNRAILPSVDLWVEGGAIDSHVSDIIIQNCFFRNNIALNAGGSINFASNTTGHSVINSTFINNDASRGGAIDSHTDILIQNCSFRNNNATRGGAITFAANTNSRILNSIFINNTAARGGAIAAIDSNLTITNSVFERNVADINGGAIFFDDGKISISFSNFKNNIADNGGGIYLIGSLSLLSSVFEENSGNFTNAGGVYASNIVLLKNNTFSSNKGHGLVFSANALDFVNNSFTSNTNYGVGALALSNSNINNNYFQSNGVLGLSFIGSNNLINHNQISDNKNGVYISGNNNKITDNTISVNKGYGIQITGLNSVISSNKINNNALQGLIVRGDKVQILNNIIMFNKNDGINLIGSNGIVSSNSLSENGQGIYASGSNTKIKGNTVNKNNGNGIYIITTGGEVSSNTINNNKDSGIYINGDKNNIFKNTVNNNNNNKGYGIYLKGKNNQIYNNTLLNNNFGIVILGNNSLIQNNLINKSKTRGISIVGNNTKIRNNKVLNGGAYGIYIKGGNNEISKTNSSNNNGIGIYIEGNNNRITNSSVYKNNATGIYLKGNGNHIIENEISNNNGKGIETNGNKLIISYNLIHSNLKNGILAYSSNSLIEANFIYKNSNNKQRACAVYYKGNNNKFQYNIIQNNGFHGLHVVGNKNIVKRSPIFNNKHNQVIIQGNKNNISNVNIQNGYKSGLKLIGNYNKITDVQVIKNKNKGIIIKGNKNKLLKVLINDNNGGLYVNGSNNYLLQSVIYSNKRYGIFNEKGIKNSYNYNYIVNNKAKYNFYRVKGSVNANYNWWGINNVKTVKNLKVKRYVIAKLNVANILKVKKKYTVTILFCSNTNKKLEKRIPNLIVYFAFKGGKISRNYTIVTKNIAKVKIKPTKLKNINFVAQVDNQLLYKQYISYNGKLYEYNLYVKIIMEKIRKYNEWLRYQNSIIRLDQSWGARMRNLHGSGYANYLYSMSAMARDWAKSSSIKIIPKKFYKKDVPGVGVAPPNLNWFDGMIARNIPDKTITKFLMDNSVKIHLLAQFVPAYRIMGLSIYPALYITGKVADAFVYSNGNMGKFFEYNFINIYGYSNLDKYGWAGEAVKGIADFTLSIDESGNMSMGGFTINVLSIALAFGAGGLAIRGTKSLTKAILKRLPQSMAKKTTITVKKFVTQIGNFTNKIPIGKISVSSLKDSIVDVAKVLTGDITPILKSITTSSKAVNILFKNSKKIDTTVKGILDLSKGDLKGALKILNSNLKTMSGLLKNKEVKVYLDIVVRGSEAKRDLNAIIKLINEGPYDVNKAYEDLKKGSQNSALKAKNTIIKYTNALKTLEKLLKLRGVI